MNSKQTSIAVALALVVVALFLFFPGALFFGNQAPVDITNQTASAVQTTTTEPITKLMTRDEAVGTGATAEAGDSVTVNYVGALTSGAVFDASASHPETASGFTFTLGAGQVIRGWDQGIAGMREGGKRTLAIPASLAYGSQAVGGVIPANSDLIFQVELLKVEKSKEVKPLY